MDDDKGSVDVIDILEVKSKAALINLTTGDTAEKAGGDPTDVYSTAFAGIDLYEHEFPLEDT